MIGPSRLGELTPGQVVHSYIGLRQSEPCAAVMSIGERYGGAQAFREIVHMRRDEHRKEVLRIAWWGGGSVIRGEEALGPVRR